MDIKKIVDNQREFYLTGVTKNIQYRKNALKNIKNWIKQNETEILSALKLDLNKDAVESYMCEIGLTLSELNHQLKHMSSYTKKKYVYTPISQFYGTSFEYYEPYGVTLIMSPWNYPFMLSI